MLKTEPKVQRNPQKRSQILTAATEEFCVTGFSRTSMDPIAERANVSKRTVYNHFPSKDALFQAILNELVTRIGELQAYPYSREEPLDHQLEAIGNIFTETITGADFMKFSRVVISRFIRSPEWARSAYDQQGA